MAIDKYIPENEKVEFHLLSQETVERLINDGDIPLPPKKVAIPKDMAWNTKQMSSKLLAGLLNGDSVQNIAKSLMDVIGNNKASAIRNARTMVTGAENRGRLDSYKNLSSQGVVMKKIWESTPDDRTRPSHIDLDGEEQDIDKEFSNKCMYPGDTGGPQEEVWQCRCSMATHIVGFKRADGTVSKVESDRDTTMHKDQMALERLNRTGLGASVSIYDSAVQEELKRYVADDGMAGQLYAKYASQLEAPINDTGETAHYAILEKRVHYDYNKVQAGNDFTHAYETHFHEYGHNIDALAGDISLKYRDSQGRTFEQIIASDWDEHFKVDAVLNSFERNLDVRSGGMGAQGWARSALNEWATKNNINRTDVKFATLRDQLRSLTTDSEIRDFIKKNIDIFTGVSYNHYITDDIIDKFCADMKSKYNLHQLRDLSDMFEKYSIEHGGQPYPLGIGHGRDYATTDGKLSVEAFAEMFSAEIRNPDSLKLIKEFLPNAYKAFTEMIGGIL